MPSWLDRRVPLVPLLRDPGALPLRTDAVAGLTTAVMLVPQAMAYAALAGLPPINGLYASIVPLAVYAALGTSGALAFGPVAIVSLLTASAIGPLAGGDVGTAVVLGAVLALLVGGIQLLLGVLRLGKVVELLSHAVISGFTSAAALVIAASQLRPLLGVEAEGGDTFVTDVAAVVGRLGQLHPLTAAVGFAAVVGLVVLRRVRPRVPAPLVVVAVLTALAAVAGLADRGVAVLGEVPSGFPAPQLPLVDLATIGQLLVPAVTIALLSYVEGFSVAMAIAKRTGERIDASQELVASGAANLAAGAFQAFPVAGGFSRTAVNHQAGARTPVASLVTAATVAVSVLLLTPLFTHLPRTVLAAIVVVAVSGLVDLRGARQAWHRDRRGAAVLAVTFVATLTLGVEPGLGVGIASSLALLGLRRLRRGRLTVTGGDADGPRSVTVALSGPLLFSDVERVRRHVDTAVGDPEAPPRRLVLDLGDLTAVDGDGADLLVELTGRAPTTVVVPSRTALPGPLRARLGQACDVMATATPSATSDTTTVRDPTNSSSG
jgi:sulfate permease, SulP family